MHSIITAFDRNRRKLGAAALALSLLLLGACSTTPAADIEGNAHEYVTTVTVGADDSAADIETRYGGSVVVWRPEAGFAIVGLDHAPASLVLQNTLDSNLNAVAAPVRAQGFTAWSGGFTAWSGGFTAWSGGYTAWSGGSTTPTTFGQNLNLWSQIRLEQGQRRAPNLGQGVKVAVIDTGVDLNHPGLQGRLAPSSDWKDFVDGDNYPQEGLYGTNTSAYGHGTAVAGVILQIAPRAVIMPIRALRPDGSGDVTAVTAAIDWAIQRGARVINLSLGTVTSNSALMEMVKYAAGQGVLVISSAGNSGDTNVTYPAADSEWNRYGGSYAIGVGSVNALDVKSSFSTHGSNLEMVAPGENIRTLYPGSQVVDATGTSFAAPMVTGTVALALGQPGLGASFIESETRNKSVSVSALNPFFDLGKGRLDVDAVMNGLGLQ